MADFASLETRDVPTVSSPSAASPDSSALSLQSTFRLESGFSARENDSEKHPKGKRKRTTSHDKAILESAYNANPKPDKAARLDIVRRVSLNEKEVQIWFQNRRQNDRRKSRPLSPQEIAALRYGGGVHIIPAQSPPMTGEDIAHEAQQSFLESGETNNVDQSPSTPPNVLSRPSSSPRLAEASFVSSDEVAPILETRNFDIEHQPQSSSQKSEAEVDSQLLSSSFSSSVGYLSNRWNLGNSFSTPSSLDHREDDQSHLDSVPNSISSANRSSPASLFTSQSSQFRLSLSLEGKAELVSSQPSPPRPSPQQLSSEVETLAPVFPTRSLQRSHSALPAVTLPPISTLTAHLPPQLTRGRSRDVHAWESCCDADTRDELTKLAENESSGSAIAAISLLRSSSSTASLSSLIQGANSTSGNSPSNGILQSNPHKRNAPPSGKSGSGRSGFGGKKPRLSGTNSSTARMQSLPSLHADKENVDVIESSVDPKKKPSNKASLSVILSPSGESDKENWSPDEDGNPTNRRRPLPPLASMSKDPILGSKNPRRAGRVLGDHSNNASKLLSHRANTAPVHCKFRGGKDSDNEVSIFEDSGDGENAEMRDEPSHPKRNEEVERFMRGDVSPSKKGDLDCIAGLLSLSQGNWR